MANFTFIRAAGIWSAGSVLLASEMAANDAIRPKLINAEDGSTHTPTSIISLTGAFGLWAETLRGGGASTASPGVLFSTLGNAFFLPTAFIGDVDFEGVNTFIGVSTFTAQTTFSALVVHNAATTNNSTFTNAGSGKIVTQGDKLEISDSDYPVVNPVILQTHLVRIGAVTPTNTVTMQNTTGIAGRMVFTGSSAVAGQFVEFELFLDYNVTYDLFMIRLQGSTGHGGVLPTNMPVMSIISVDSVGTVTTIASATCTPGTAAVYEAGVNTQIIIPSPFTPASQTRYFLRVTNEHGGTGQMGLQFIHCIGQGNRGTLGRTS